MKKRIIENMLVIALILCISFLSVSAQSNTSLKSIIIEEYTIGYDETMEADTDGDGFNDRQSYYKEGVLVFTTYDYNTDGKPDLWLRYDDELYLDLVIIDKDTDGKIDDISRINKEGYIIEDTPLFRVDIIKIISAIATVIILVALMILKFRKKKS